jgi:hypothetical protein
MSQQYDTAAEEQKQNKKNRNNNKNPQTQRDRFKLLAIVHSSLFHVPYLNVSEV